MFSSEYVCLCKLFKIKGFLKIKSENFEYATPVLITEFEAPESINTFKSNSGK